MNRAKGTSRAWRPRHEKRDEKAGLMGSRLDDELESDDKRIADAVQSLKTDLRAKRKKLQGDVGDGFVLGMAVKVVDRTHAAIARFGSILDNLTKTSGKQRPSQQPQPETVGDRRAMVNKYIEDVFRIKGKRITRTEIWKMAKYKSRTEFERWERNDPKNPNKAANERFMRILTEKPHLK
jgi:hypothetical protein